MLTRVKGLFEDLIYLYEARESAIYNKCVILLDFYPNNKISYDDVMEFFRETPHGGSIYVKKVIESIETGDYLKYLDSWTSRESRVALNLFNYLRQKHKDTSDKTLDSVKKLVNENLWLRTYSQYIPFIVYGANTENLEHYKLTFLEAVRLLATNSRSEIEKIPEDFILKIIGKKLLPGRLSTKILLDNFDEAKEFLNSNIAVSKIPFVSYSKFLKLMFPVVKILGWYNSVSTPDPTYLESGNVTKNGYTVHYCDSIEDVQKVLGCGINRNPYNNWCIVKDQGLFNSYTVGGRFVIFLKKGFESIPRTPPPSAKREDAYALSMIAAAFSPEGSLRTVDSRRNIERGEYLSASELEEVVGIKLSSLKVKKDETQFHLQIENGVLKKATGSYMPYVEIPAHVHTIGTRAFSSFRALFKVDLSNVKKIEDFAFSNCANLSEVVFSKNLTSIGRMAFSKCTSLEEVLIESKSVMIDSTVFSECKKLKRVHIAGAVNNPLISTFENCIGLESVFIGSVSGLKFTFFGCSNLKSYVIPNSAQSLESRVFSHCFNLQNVEIPNSVKKIGKHCFYKTKIQRLKIPNSVQEIDPDAFEGMDSLKEFILEKGNPTYEVQGSFLVNKLNKILICAVPSKEDILSVPDNLTSVRSTSFGGSFKKIIFPKSWNSFSRMFMHNHPTAEEIVLKADNPTLERGAFSNCVNLKSIKCSTGIKKFSGIINCPKLTRTDISDDVVITSEGGFEFCYSMKSPYLSLGGKVLVHLVFDPNKLIVVPDGVERIALGAFRYSSKDSDNYRGLCILLPETVKQIEKGVLEDLSRDIKIFTKSSSVSIPDNLITRVTVFNTEEAGTLFKSGWTVYDNIPYVKAEGGWAVAWSGSKKEVTVPDFIQTEKGKEPVVGVAKSAFDDRGMKEIRLPNSIKFIDDWAFAGATSLEKIDLSNTETVSIGRNAFAFCKELREVKLNKGLKKIDFGTFTECSSLDEIVIPDSVNILGKSAFEACSFLTSVVLPKGIEIPKDCFKECGNLEEVVNLKYASKVHPEAFPPDMDHLV